MEADFSGYATKAGLKCTDGRTIMPDAFKHQDKMRVPLVWQHGHSDPDNILGHAILENRSDGVYAYGFFNSTDKAKNLKIAVEHGDVTHLSIYANQLVERSKQVLHGAIREVSLVLAGANSGAKIDFVAVSHADGEVSFFDDEAIIHTGLPIEADGNEPDDQKNSDPAPPVDASVETPPADEVTPDEVTPDEADPDEATPAEESGSEVAHAASDDDDPTVEDIYNGFDETQKNVVHYMISAAVASVLDIDDDEDVEHAENTEGDLTHQEGTNMRNIFENGSGEGASQTPTLTHDQISTVMTTAGKLGSFKEAMLAHAEDYGITDIELLFPDAKTINNTPELISRRMEWVATVLGGTKHSPFAKVKTIVADITEPEARAKGYIKGTRKKDEVFKLLKRTTSPATIYKKQKLDRDDILDITDLDVVAYLKAEMRLMIEEEIARAILVGDGRSSMDEDKVKDPEGAIDGTGIRSILNDDDLYSVKVQLAANVSPKDAVKGLVRARSKYRGSGKPTLFVSDVYLTDIMLEEDKFGRPLYETEQALADKLRVKDIVTVDLFDEHASLFAIMVSLQDYTIGSNRGGELTSFEDFDIDFNQHKYLQETRLSGGLTKPFSAVVVTRAQGTAVTTVTAPSYNGTTKVITIPSTTGVVYTIDDEPVSAGAQPAIDEPTEVEAKAATGYYLPNGATTSWVFNP